MGVILLRINIQHPGLPHLGTQISVLFCLSSSLPGTRSLHALFKHSHYYSPDHKSLQLLI